MEEKTKDESSTLTERSVQSSRDASFSKEKRKEVKMDIA